MGNPWPPLVDAEPLATKMAIRHSIEVGYVVESVGSIIA